MIRLHPRIVAWGRAAYAAAWLAALVIVWVLVVAMVAGCGAASRVATSTACASLMLTIGERRDYEPARAVADIDSVAAVCRRLDADAGAP